MEFLTVFKKFHSSKYQLLSKYNQLEVMVVVVCYFSLLLLLLLLLLCVCVCVCVCVTLEDILMLE